MQTQCYYGVTIDVKSNAIYNHHEVSIFSWILWCTFRYFSAFRYSDEILTFSNKYWKIAYYLRRMSSYLRKYLNYKMHLFRTNTNSLVLYSIEKSIEKKCEFHSGRYEFHLFIPSVVFFIQIICIALSSCLKECGNIREKKTQFYAHRWKRLSTSRATENDSRKKCRCDFFLCSKHIQSAWNIYTFEYIKLNGYRYLWSESLLWTELDL